VTPPTPRPPLLAGLLVGSTAAVAILAAASLVGATLCPEAHWRSGLTALLSRPALALGARAYLEVR
jgi:hypothetical protein